LYERLGGGAAIKSVVDKFYVYMLDDKRVNEFFKNTDMNKQRKRQTDFITMVTGGPNNYEGVDMKKAHEKFKIGKFEFDATWENLTKSLRDHHVDEKLIE
jgi:hemoglobin